MKILNWGGSNFSSPFCLVHNQKVRGLEFSSPFEKVIGVFNQLIFSSPCSFPLLFISSPFCKKRSIFVILKYYKDFFSFLIVHLLSKNFFSFVNESQTCFDMIYVWIVILFESFYVDLSCSYFGNRDSNINIFTQ